jgi:uncharacterized protein YaiE (UPF0345 family)
MKPVTVVLAACVLIFGTSTPAAAQLSVNVTPPSFTFPSADPETTPVITASQPVTVEWKIVGNRAWTLSVRGTNLTSGANSIAVTQVTWTAVAPLTTSGTLMNSDQALARGTGGGNTARSITFFLRNSWTYNVGHYAQTITFTLSSP